MSDEVTFEDILYHLHQNPEPSTRAEAARLLGEHVGQLSDDEYELAHKALNERLTDSAPIVIMAVMQALSRYSRKARQQAKAARDAGDSRPVVAIPLCTVCNKPEAIADGSICPHDNCPYKK